MHTDNSSGLDNMFHPRLSSWGLCHLYIYSKISLCPQIVVATVELTITNSNGGQFLYSIFHLLLLDNSGRKFHILCITFTPISDSSIRKFEYELVHYVEGRIVAVISSQSFMQRLKNLRLNIILNQINNVSEIKNQEKIATSR